ncbi:LPXTG cell wall anchor domain-containing protein [Enterococcus songbeiensis]|uniref:LPXTG cell wall anchor domain-containing protein n=1 Tax=Enterococcus songbeiensis TaxID=2559927 RepID=UPI0010F55069|nr:LPXTG cell wall anchor domain-containing protein [Enterococcus songbeiensis]
MLNKIGRIGVATILLGGLFVVPTAENFAAQTTMAREPIYVTDTEIFFADTGENIHSNIVKVTPGQVLSLGALVHFYGGSLANPSGIQVSINGAPAGVSIINETMLQPDPDNPKMGTAFFDLVIPEEIALTRFTISFSVKGAGIGSYAPETITFEVITGGDSSSSDSSTEPSSSDSSTEPSRSSSDSSTEPSRSSSDSSTEPSRSSSDSSTEPSRSSSDSSTEPSISSSNSSTEESSSGEKPATSTSMVPLMSNQRSDSQKPTTTFAQNKKRLPKTNDQATSLWMVGAGMILLGLGGVVLRRK